MRQKFADQGIRTGPDYAAQAASASLGDHALEDVKNKATAAAQSLGERNSPAKDKQSNRPPGLSLFRFGAWSVQRIARGIAGFGAAAMGLGLAFAIAVWTRPDLWILWLASACMLLIALIIVLLAGYVRAVMRGVVQNANNQFSQLRREISRLKQHSPNKRLKRVSNDIIKLEAKATDAENALRALSEDYRNSTKNFADQLNSRLKQMDDALRLELSNLTRQTAAAHSPEEFDSWLEELAEVKKTLNAIQSASETTQNKLSALEKQFDFLSGANAANIRTHARRLDNQKLHRFFKVWAQNFELDLTRRQIGYLAHKACLFEEQCVGRLAASIETILFRLFALRSIKSKSLDVLEIGTLFGVGAGILYKLRGADSDMRLTLIDPLDGFYGAGNLDPVTGDEVNEETLAENFERLGVPAKNWRLIKAFSTEPKARAAASDRLYDLIIIDGDHTADGVAKDYELYGDLVKPGGLLLFDDYDSPNWPDVKPFVDQNVRPQHQWAWIGGEFRTGILRKKISGEE